MKRNSLQFTKPQNPSSFEPALDVRSASFGHIAAASAESNHIPTTATEVAAPVLNFKAIIL